MNFSIIIPTFNRSKSLQKLVNVFLYARYTYGKTQLVVVDNNSTDSTESLMRSIVTSYPDKDIVYCKEYKRGPSYARNMGLSHAKYSHTICCDDDVIVSGTIINSFYNVYKRFPHAAIIGGKILMDFDKTKLPLINSIDEKYRFVYAGLDYGPKLRTLSYPDVLYSACISFNLNVFQSKKIFNERVGRLFLNTIIFGEDYELCARSQLEKKTVIYDPSISVKNIVSKDRLTFRYVYKRIICSGIESYFIDQSLKKISIAIKQRSFVDFGTIKYYIKQIVAGKKPRRAAYSLLFDVSREIAYRITHIVTNLRFI